MFMKDKDSNIDADVVRDFGFEWSRVDQSSLLPVDQMEIFDGYFHVFPWDDLPSDAVGADIGCGSGQWDSLAAPRVGYLQLVDPSGDALDVARCNLSESMNVTFHQASVDELPFEEGSLDFADSLGVLLHVPDAAKSIHSIARLLKPGAPF